MWNVQLLYIKLQIIKISVGREFSSVTQGSMHESLRKNYIKHVILNNPQSIQHSYHITALKENLKV